MMYKFLLIICLIPNISLAAPPSGGVAVIPSMIMMSTMQRGGMPSGVKTIEEYAKVLAPNNSVQKTKIILTLQMGFFLEKAFEKLGKIKAKEYANVLRAVGKNPLNWTKIASIPRPERQSVLERNIIALLESDKEFINDDKNFNNQAKNLYLQIRDFAYSMGYVRLFDLYFDFPGSSDFTKMVKNTLPKSGRAREMKEKQISLDKQMMQIYYTGLGFVVFIIIAIAFIAVFQIKKPERKKQGV